MPTEFLQEYFGNNYIVLVSFFQHFCNVYTKLYIFNVFNGNNKFFNIILQNNFFFLIYNNFHKILD